MRMWLSVAIGTVVLGVSACPLLAQQKTVKACQEEWRTNKAENQAKGITEKAYVAQCRTGASAAQPASAPGAKPTATPSAATSAPGKTVKACREEWRTNKTAYQAAKVTEKAYVDKCRAGETVALPTPPTASPSAAPSTAPPTTTPSAATSAPGKTVKACREEWRANKTAYQAAKVTEKAYVDKCRAGETVALPTPPTSSPSVPPSTASPSAAPSSAPPSSAPTVKPSATITTPAPTGAGQFETELQAKAQCPADIVVWVNRRSKIYHFTGYKSYGTTKDGAYMCEREATMQGFRASKTEKRPSA
jgi:hypothetical protein